MRFVRAIGVSNLDRKMQLMSDETVGEIPRHGLLLPNIIRCIICGPSNYDKTNALISLIESPHGIRFENVYVYSKSLFQPKYWYLEELLESINGISYHAFSTVTSYHRRRHFSIQYSYSMMWLVIIRILLENIFLWIDIRTLIVFISVGRMQKYRNI